MFAAGAPRCASLLVLLALSACERRGVQPTAVMQAADSADQVLEGFVHHVTTDGVRKSRIEADTAWFYEATQRATLHNVRIKFYDAKGAERSKLTARRADYRWQDGSLDAEGDVVLIAPDGGKLQSQVLKLDNKENRISTDRAFRFERGAERIEGTSLQSDPEFTNVVTNRPRGVAGRGILLPGQRDSVAAKDST
ncbi:MAG TPA: LPS export ABC transporter periplasmic protein LptC [Gemmatimonadales bacterium]|nr:LPS export ABC transporter periplasmic protein LptC [Gemmatimonadales bacterium]